MRRTCKSFPAPPLFCISGRKHCGEQATMSHVVSEYRDQRAGLSKEDYDEKLSASTTLYVGNLSFYTSEEQIYELFSMCGDVKRVIMGLDRFKKTPCGFCFVEYYTREETINAIRYISGTKLDDRIIRTDLDLGFVEGRQFGRGKTGGQVRDDYRMDVDEDRGGIGGGALRVMQRQGFDLRDLIGTPQERGEEPVREVSMTQ